MPSDTKHIILANINVNLYSCTLRPTFHKAEQQQIWGEVVLLTPASVAYHFWI